MEVVNTDESSEDEANNPRGGDFSLQTSYHNPEDLVQFVISKLQARGLKKGLFFNPDPYVKFKIGPGYNDHNSIFLPHHGQNCRTTVVENTTEPTWPEQVSSILGACATRELYVRVVSKNILFFKLRVFNLTQLQAVIFYCI